MGIKDAVEAVSLSRSWVQALIADVRRKLRNDFLLITGYDGCFKLRESDRRKVSQHARIH